MVNWETEITEEQLKAVGFVENKNHKHPGFDEWIHSKDKRFGMGEYNGQGYLIEGIDWHEPIKTIEDLKAIVDILLPP